MRKKQVIRNAAASVVQVVFSGVLMLVLYRYLLDTIGVARLGIWSVVLATTSAARITELGMTGGVIRFVAKYVAHSDRRKAGLVIQTSVISLGAFVGVILCAAYLPLRWMLGIIIPVDALPEAIQILPYAVATLWIGTLSGIFQSGLDGCQRTDLRALFNILNSILTLILAVLLVPEFGLMGLAYTQLCMAGLLSFLSWVYLRLELTSLPYIPWRWNASLFREIIRYGIGLQVISFTSMLFDPMTKALLSKFGGLASVGYYEMASRMIMQFRALLVAPNRVLVPVIADLQETESDRIVDVYRFSYRLQVFLSLLLYAGVVALIPALMVLWVGSTVWPLVLYSVLLALLWFHNSMTLPAYFSYLGMGELKWNMVTHVVICVLNAVLGVILGMEYGAIGVVTAWVIASVIGSSIVILAYQYDQRIPLREIFPGESNWLMLACIAGIFASWFIYEYLHMELGSVWIFFACLTVFVAAVAIPGWRHPMRGRIFGLIAAR